MITISYDGAWPNLCSGRLIVTIDNITWDFGQYVLSSGGRVCFDDDWSNAHIEEGPWGVNEWPDDFPENLKALVIDAINSEITHGCCGGCI